MLRSPAATWPAFALASLGHPLPLGLGIAVEELLGELSLEAVVVDQPSVAEDRDTVRAMLHVHRERHRMLAHRVVEHQGDHSLVHVDLGVVEL